MIEAPLVSVITAFLNPGNWLIEAVESVIHQTYSNWELILVDDGSIEKDTSIALAYSKKFPGKIMYVEHDGHANKGLTTSRNTGIAHGSGDFFAFLDADDCWLPEKLTRQLNVFKQYPQAQMICEASCFWFSWKDVNAKDYIQLIGTPSGIYHPPQLMKILYPFGEGQPPCPTGIIITKEALKSSGGFEERFSDEYQLYEDQAFLIKLYATEIVYISEDANNLYRKRNYSMSSAASNEDLYKKVRLFYLEWLQEYFQTSSRNPQILKLINNFKQKLISP